MRTPGYLRSRFPCLGSNTEFEASVSANHGTGSGRAGTKRGIPRTGVYDCHFIGYGLLIKGPLNCGAGFGGRAVRAPEKAGRSHSSLLTLKTEHHIVRLRVCNASVKCRIHRISLVAPGVSTTVICPLHLPMAVCRASRVQETVSHFITYHSILGCS